MSLYDLVRCNTTAVGTASITFGSAIVPYLTPTQAGVPSGATVSYSVITFSDLNQTNPVGIEAGTGTYSGGTLTRNPIVSNNSNAKINLTGISQVVITGLANNFAWGWDAKNVTSTGTTNVLAKDYGDVLVNYAGAVTIQLPAASTRLGVPVSVVDIGGSSVITILPYGSETIMSLPNLTINGNYGGYTIWPISSGGWYQK